MSGHYDALARTTLLLNQEWFSGEADDETIADALLASTVRLVGEAESMRSRAGQTALVTAFMLIARLGIGIEVQVPDVAVIDRVAPLREPRLPEALIELGGDLIPGARVRSSAGEVEETFVFGAVSDHAGAVVQVIATDVEACLQRTGNGAVCTGSQPYGGLAAGAAAAAIALEAARPKIEAAVGLPARSPRPSPGPPVTINLAELFPRLATAPRLALGDFDAVSGGAITHALAYCLLRIPGLQGRLRVIEQQAADLSNVTRYSLLRASDEDTDKVTLLERASSERLEIHGVRSLFTRDTRTSLAPLASLVLVGVDDIEARWWVQESEPAWLAVGATSNHLAQLSIHIPDSPCAACVHPVALPPGTIPTISFVSFWAGLLQSCALMSGPGDPVNVMVYPFALGGTSWAVSVQPHANAACRIGCRASRLAARARPA
jgi:molybdopterin/thiamine biosynthesis adenylyltransferase